MIAPSKPNSVSLFRSVVQDPDGNAKYDSGYRHNLRTTTGIDWQAIVMGGVPVQSTAARGNSTTAATATTYTLTGVTAVANALAGHILVAVNLSATYTATNFVYGIIVSNTAGPPAVATIDRWYDPSDPGNATPPSFTSATSGWIVIPGGAPIAYIALSADASFPATHPAVGDTTLIGELSTNGFSRALATYAHTGGTNTFTLSKAFTCTGGAGTTITGEGVFTSVSAGTMPFESAEPSPPTLITGDQLTQSVTVTY